MMVNKFGSKQWDTLLYGKTIDLFYKILKKKVKNNIFFPFHLTDKDNHTLCINY